jgi:hypothetical protein
LPCGIQHGIQPKAKARQRIRMNLNLQRLPLAAEDRDLGHAAHGQESWADSPFCRRVQIHQRAPIRRRADDQRDARR